MQGKGMDRLPFDKPGKFRKGNIHTHSTCSDGTLPPGEVCRRYREAGYHFLAITDHFLEQFGYPIVDTRPFRTEGFTTLIGAELHAPIPGSAMSGMSAPSTCRSTSSRGAKANRDPGSPPEPSRPALSSSPFIRTTPS